MNIMCKCFSVDLFSSSFSVVGKGSQCPSEQVEEHNKIWFQLLLCHSCVLSGAHLSSVSVNGIFQKPFWEGWFADWLQAGQSGMQADCTRWVTALWVSWLGCCWVLGSCVSSAAWGVINQTSIILMDPGLEPGKHDVSVSHSQNCWFIWFILAAAFQNGFMAPLQRHLALTDRNIKYYPRKYTNSKMTALRGALNNLFRSFSKNLRTIKYCWMRS